ncbi:MAG TPA: RNA methyltransferase [Terracidiphilus sp.]|nr:RNA methyltransferase [Terracidiphilus sp.]
MRVTGLIRDLGHALHCKLAQPHPTRPPPRSPRLRNPLNVGAAARAMANFGFPRLAVVSPYAPNWREARSAVGAPDLLQNAAECAILAEALADCTLVAGTGSLAHRRPEQPVLSLPALLPIVDREIARGGRIALVFGPEKRGLTRDDLSHCHLLVEIPTAPEQPSMNLGQAVAVCLYELAARNFGSGGTASEPPAQLPTSALENQTASSAALDLLAEVVEQVAEAAHYSQPEMRAANRHDAQLLLRRLDLSERDARRIVGLFRRILWRLKH